MMVKCEMFKSFFNLKACKSLNKLIYLLDIDIDTDIENQTFN